MRGGTRNDRIEHYLFTSQQFKRDRPLLYRGGRADSLERDGQLYYFKLQQRVLGFCQYDDGRPLASGVCMSLNCENTQQVDQEYQRLQSLGIKTQVRLPATQSSRFIPSSLQIRTDTCWSSRKLSMKNNQILLPPQVLHLIEQLEAAGEEAWIVGGCVRDSLMGKIPHDWDMTTSANTGRMKEIFSDKRLLLNGEQHGNGWCHRGWSGV